MEKMNLKELQIFKGVDDDAIEAVIQETEKESFEKGRLIIYEGERIDNKGYIILSGQVTVQLQKLEIATLGAGEIFGEMGLLTGEKRKATVRASQDTDTLVIDFDKLMTLIDNDGNIINKEVIRRMEANIIMEK